eukprot:24178-Eustigmatos_ZCMA.PRE.1
MCVRTSLPTEFLHVNHYIQTAKSVVVSAVRILCNASLDTPRDAIHIIGVTSENDQHLDVFAELSVKATLQETRMSAYDTTCNVKRWSYGLVERGGVRRRTDT